VVEPDESSTAGGCAARARARATPLPVPLPVVPVSAHARREGSGQGAVDGRRTRRGWHAGVGPWDLGTQQRAIGREPPTRSAAMITPSRLQNMRTLIRHRGRCHHDAPPARWPSRVPCARPENLCPVGKGRQSVKSISVNIALESRASGKKRTTSIWHPTKPPSPKPSFCRSVACNQGVQSMIHPFNGRLSGRD
jgi:hypothetical protein